MGKTNQRLFETESIDLSSYLATCGTMPVIEVAESGKRALFIFIESPKLLTAIVDYERGASLPAKKLLNTRSFLYREASKAVKGAA